MRAAAEVAYFTWKGRLYKQADFINYSSPLSSDTAGTYWRVNFWSLDAVSEGSCHFLGHQADLPLACLWYLLQVLLPGLPFSTSRETMKWLPWLAAALVTAHIPSSCLLSGWLLLGHRACLEQWKVHTGGFHCMSHVQMSARHWSVNLEVPFPPE